MNYKNLVEIFIVLWQDLKRKILYSVKILF